jgi:hypothetical protein
MSKIKKTPWLLKKPAGTTWKDGVKARDLEPDKTFKLDVFIYDITGTYALAKTVNTKYGFFDYCQLAKIAITLENTYFIFGSCDITHPPVE